MNTSPCFESQLRCYPSRQPPLSSRWVRGFPSFPQPSVSPSFPGTACEHGGWPCLPLECLGYSHVPSDQPQAVGALGTCPTGLVWRPEVLLKRCAVPTLSRQAPRDQTLPSLPRHLLFLPGLMTLLRIDRFLQATSRTADISQVPQKSLARSFSGLWDKRKPSPLSLIFKSAPQSKGSFSVRILGPCSELSQPPVLYTEGPARGWAWGGVNTCYRAGYWHL